MAKKQAAETQPSSPAPLPPEARLIFVKLARDLEAAAAAQLREKLAAEAAD